MSDDDARAGDRMLLVLSVPELRAAMLDSSPRPWVCSPRSLRSGPGARNEVRPHVRRSRGRWAMAAMFATADNPSSDIGETLDSRWRASRMGFALSGSAQRTCSPASRPGCRKCYARSAAYSRAHETAFSSRPAGWQHQCCSESAQTVGVRKDPEPLVQAMASSAWWYVLASACPTWPGTNSSSSARSVGTHG